MNKKYYERWRGWGARNKRETDRQTDRPRQKETDRQTDRNRDTETQAQTQRQGPSN